MRNWDTWAKAATCFVVAQLIGGCLAIYWGMRLGIDVAIRVNTSYAMMGAITALIVGGVCKLRKQTLSWWHFVLSYFALLVVVRWI